MPTRNDTKKVAAKGLSVAQYRYEWIDDTLISRKSLSSYCDPMR